MKRIPLLPTLIVLIAAAIMIRLGFWQLDRLHQKEAMLAEYESAAHATRITDFANDLLIDGPAEYTRVRINCTVTGKDQLIAGRSAAGEPGWRHQFACEFPYRLKGRAEATVVIGWSANPVPVEWAGGTVTGTLTPAKAPAHRVVADPPLAGLQPNAKPDPRDLPNNHLAYAVQWFAFAAVALVIYALAVRKRLRP
jgi:surfeit locus 1 family protein